MENEFPPNSHSKREARPARDKSDKTPPKKEVRQVTRGGVIVRKRPLYKKFFDAFRPEDNVGFVEYTVIDVLVPGIKDAMADAVHGTIDNLLGGGGGAGRRRRGGGGYTSYNRMSDARPRGRRDRDDDRRGGRREERRTPSGHDEVILRSRVECEEVLDQMYELLSTYDVVTKRELLSMIGEPHSFTDEDWGWTDLRGARIHRIGSQGYLLDLPRVEPLD